MARRKSKWSISPGTVAAIQLWARNQEMKREREAEKQRQTDEDRKRDEEYRRIADAQTAIMSGKQYAPELDPWPEGTGPDLSMETDLSGLLGPRGGPAYAGDLETLPDLRTPYSNLDEIMDIPEMQSIRESSPQALPGLMSAGMGAIGLGEREGEQRRYDYMEGMIPGEGFETPEDMAAFKERFSGQFPKEMFVQPDPLEKYLEADMKDSRYESLVGPGGEFEYIWRGDPISPEGQQVMSEEQVERLRGIQEGMELTPGQAFDRGAGPGQDWINRAGFWLADHPKGTQEEWMDYATTQIAKAPPGQRSYNWDEIAEGYNGAKARFQANQPKGRGKPPEQKYGITLPDGTTMDVTASRYVQHLKDIGAYDQFEAPEPFDFKAEYDSYSWDNFSMSYSDLQKKADAEARQIEVDHPTKKYEKTMIDNPETFYRDKMIQARRAIDQMSAESQIQIPQMPSVPTVGDLAPEAPTVPDWVPEVNIQDYLDAIASGDTEEQLYADYLESQKETE